MSECDSVTISGITQRITTFCTHLHSTPSLDGGVLHERAAQNWLGTQRHNPGQGNDEVDNLYAHLCDMPTTTSERKQSCIPENIKSQEHKKLGRLRGLCA